MGSRFVNILKTSTTELLELERALVDALPNSAHMLVLCRLACQKKFPEEVDVNFFIYKDEEPKEGNTEIFVFCVERPNFHTTKGVIVLTPTVVTSEMIHAFDEAVDWSEAQVFHCVQRSFWPHLEAMITKHTNLKTENTKGIPGIMLAMLDLEKAKALDVPLPGPEFELKPIDKDYVRLVVEQWTWRASHSEEVIRNCTSRLISAGLFLKANHGAEDLVSNVLLSPLGAMNILHTSEQHRRKGFGKIVLQWATKQAASKFGIPVLAEVEEWNVASKNLIEKAGFTELYKTKWYYYDPPTPAEIIS